MRYFFILGRNPRLSLAELYATLPKGWQPLIFSGQILVAEIREFEIKTLIKRLGGMIKIGTLALEHWNTGTLEPLVKFIAPQANKLKKLFIGFSAYALYTNAKLPTVRELRALGIAVKRKLQQQDYKVRLVTSKEIALSSVIVKQEKLLTQGAEIVLFYGTPRARGSSSVGSEVEPPDISIGQTLAVQEFEGASARDFGRPARSMGVGMLPIQLTKILINLARTPKEKVLLDPFCGLGTVLTEAAQMGYNNLVGSDIDPSMTNATADNLRWIQSKFPMSNFQFPKLFTASVEQISKHLPARSVDAIVTEPYLGPTRGIMNYESGIKNELVKLYAKAFHEFAKILKPGGKVVFIFPAFKQGVALIKTSDQVLPQIKKLGFTPIQLLPKTTSTFYFLDSIFSIIYSRPDQKVLREIFVFEFKK